VNVAGVIGMGFHRQSELGAKERGAAFGALS